MEEYLDAAITVHQFSWSWQLCCEWPQNRHWLEELWYWDYKPLRVIWMDHSWNLLIDDLADTMERKIYIQKRWISLLSPARKEKELKFPQPQEYASATSQQNGAIAYIMRRYCRRHDYCLWTEVGVAAYVTGWRIINFGAAWAPRSSLHIDTATWSWTSKKKNPRSWRWLYTVYAVNRSKEDWNRHTWKREIVVCPVLFSLAQRSISVRPKHA